MYSNLLWKCSIPFLAIILLSAPAMAQGEFVGSDKCRACHQEIYDTWKESSHAKAFQALTPENDWVIADWQGEVKLKSGSIPEATIRLSKDAGGSYFATLVDSKDPSREVTYKVEATQGSGTVKGQQYYIRIGNNYFSLPMNWQTVASRFIPASLNIWYNEDGSLKTPAPDASWEMTCAGCHQTGLEYKKAGEGYEAECSEMSIGCEKCHGSGAKHVAASGTENTILNPRDLEYERGMDVCNQCHDTQGRSVPDGEIRGAWSEAQGHGYVVGEPLSDYMQSSGGPGSSSALGPLSGRDTYHMLAGSKHFEAKTNCFDCHDPHGGPGVSQLKRADFNNALCLRCHGKDEAFSSPSMIMAHTKHGYDPDVQGTSRCTGCHQIQSRRIRTPSTGDGMPRMPGIMAGFLEVITPIQSMEMFKNNPDAASTNSCSKCHEDWGGNEAGYRKGLEAFEAKFGSE